MNKKVLLSALCLTAAASLMVGCQKKEEGQNKQEENNQQTKVEEKKLTCELTEDDGSKIKYTLTYNGDNYSKAYAMSTKKYKDEKATSVAYDELKETVKKDNTAKGVSANAQSSGLTVTASYTFTVADLDDNGKKVYEEAGLKELDGKKYDDAKSALETAGFKCN